MVKLRRVVQLAEESASAGRVTSLILMGDELGLMRGINAYSRVGFVGVASQLILYANFKN